VVLVLRDGMINTRRLKNDGRLLQQETDDSSHTSSHTMAGKNHLLLWAEAMLEVLDVIRISPAVI